MKKQLNKIIFLTVLFSFIVTSLIILFIYITKDNEIKLINNTLINNAKAYFNNILVTRKWNSNYNGVYVLDNGEIEPNPYLVNNHTFTKDGQKLIKINPAWMTRQISQISDLNDQYKFKMSSLKPLNPVNKPNNFEKEALTYLESNTDERFFYKFDLENNEFDLLGVLYVEQSCLECHAHQEYKIGEIRGGLSVTLPLDSYKKQYNYITRNSILFSIIIVLIAIIVTIILLKYIVSTTKNKMKIEKLNKNLEKRIEYEIKKNRERDRIYHQQSKLASMGEMINNIAHQWRQPLSAISSATSGMQIQKEYNLLTDELFNESTEMILKQSEYMSKTIDDFKNFFKSSNTLKEFEVNEHIQNNIKLMSSSLSSNNIDYEIHNSQKPIRLISIESQLTQVILNILNNAKDQLKKLSSNETKVIEVFIRQEQKFVFIDIVDNGGGIDEKIIDKIFEPYFTTKHKSQGTGIGLYMSREIINEHLNGELKVSNVEFEYNKTKYKGAKFSIKLPFTTPIKDVANNEDKN